MSKVASILTLLTTVACLARPGFVYGEPGPAGNDFVPVRCELELEVEYEARMLSGSMKSVLQNSGSEPLQNVSLLLYRLLRVSDARDGSGRNLVFTQGVQSVEGFPVLQLNQVVVTLAEPLPPGERTTIEINYNGYLLGYTETGMGYVHDRIQRDFTILRDDAFVFPQPGVPAMPSLRAAPKRSFTYLARITVPEDLIVANGGRLEAREETDEAVTYVYSSIKPSWRMDFAIAKFGEVSQGPVRVFYLPEDEAGATTVAGAARNALQLFEGWFGPPPGAAELTFIEIPDGWGSQTDVTTIIQTAAAFRDPGRMHEVYHEISHLWNVTPKEALPPRWEEGLASFLEYLAVEEITGEPAVDARANRVIGWLKEKLPDRPRWTETPMIEYGKADLTDLSYWVGGLFFDLYYRVAGRDGFLGVIRSYQKEYAVTGGSTDDLARMARENSPPVVGTLIDEWIYTTDWTRRVMDCEGIDDLAQVYLRAD